MGSLLPLGIGARLVGEDVAWVFQPYLAVIAALLALVLWQVLSAVAKRWWRLAAVVVAAQPAILYAYGHWTGVKELASALLVALAASLAFERRGDASARGWIPLAAAAAAILGVLSVGGARLAAPARRLDPAGRALRAPTAQRRGGGRRARRARTARGRGGRELVPRRVTSRRCADDDRLANLIQPLNPLQSFGIWPTGDFRTETGGVLADDRARPARRRAGDRGPGAIAAPPRRAGRRTPRARCSARSRYWVAALAVDRGKGVRDRLPGGSSPSPRRAARGSPAPAGASRRASPRRSWPVGVLWSNAYAYRNVNARAARPARRAGGDRRTIRRPGAGVDDGVPARTACVTSSAASTRKERPSCAADRCRRSTGRSRRRARRPISTSWRSRACSSTARSCCAARRSPAGRPRRTSSAGEAAGTRSGSGLLQGRPLPRTCRSATRAPLRPPPGAPTCSGSHGRRERSRPSSASRRWPCSPRGRRGSRRRSSSRGRAVTRSGSRGHGAPRADVLMDGQRIASVPAHLDRSSQYTDLGSTVLARGVHTVRVAVRAGKARAGDGRPGIRARPARGHPRRSATERDHRRTRRSRPAVRPDARLGRGAPLTDGLRPERRRRDGGLPSGR